MTRPTIHDYDRTEVMRQGAAELALLETLIDCCPGKPAEQMLGGRMDRKRADELCLARYGHDFEAERSYRWTQQEGQQ